MLFPSQLYVRKSIEALTFFICNRIHQEKSPYVLVKGMSVERTCFIMTIVNLIFLPHYTFSYQLFVAL